MKIIISCHCDTVFSHPFCIFEKGILRGANDNFASILTVGRILDDSCWEDGNVILHLTEDEEMYQDGAKYIAKRNNPKDTLIIVQDITTIRSHKINFTIENVKEVRLTEIRKALKNFTGQYKIVPNGTESEAWLYAEQGFSVIELDIPIFNGEHSLDSITHIKDHVVASNALLTLIRYFKDKDIASIRPEDK